MNSDQQAWGVIPMISQEQGRVHARWMYELLGHQQFGATELRAMRGNHVLVAYADNAESFVELAMAVNRKGYDVYVGLQPRPAAFFDYAPNEWQDARGGQDGNVAKAGDIEFVTAVALDIDADTQARRQGQPASDEEVQACIDVALRLAEFEGLAGTSGVAVSGNGSYVLNPIVAIEVDGHTAAKLKVLEQQWIHRASPLPAGVRIDPILDPVRIVRIIGTVNYKGTPVRGRPHRGSCFVMRPAIGGCSRLLTEQILHMPPPRPSYGSKTVEKVQPVRGDMERFRTCRFVQWVGRDARTIPEPAWHDFLVQCAWLEGGDGIAHELSRLDPVRYSFAQTQARLSRIRRAGYRPKRCQNLAGTEGSFRCPVLGTCPARRPLELAARTYRKEETPPASATPQAKKPATKTVSRPRLAFD